MTAEELMKECQDYARICARDGSEVHPCAMSAKDGELHIYQTIGDIRPTQLMQDVRMTNPGGLVGLINEAWAMNNPPPGVDMNAMTPEERKEKGVYSVIIVRIFQMPSMKYTMISRAKFTDDRVLLEFEVNES